MYRIRSRDLIRRLSQETLAVDAAGPVFAGDGGSSGHRENGSAPSTIQAANSKSV
jgi:hypothetical protein